MFGFWEVCFSKLYVLLRQRFVDKGKASKAFVLIWWFLTLHCSTFYKSGNWDWGFLLKKVIPVRQWQRRLKSGKSTSERRRRRCRWRRRCKTCFYFIAHWLIRGFLKIFIPFAKSLLMKKKAPMLELVRWWKKTISARKNNWGADSRKKNRETHPRSNR